MTLARITDLDTPIGDILPSVGQGVLIESEGVPRYVVAPLDDDVLDLLLERNPAFIAHCQAIRQSMHAGQFLTHEDVRKRFGE